MYECMYVCIYVNLPVLQLEFMAGVLGGNNLVLTHMFLVDTHHYQWEESNSKFRVFGNYTFFIFILFQIEIHVSKQ